MLADKQFAARERKWISVSRMGKKLGASPPAQTHQTEDAIPTIRNVLPASGTLLLPPPAIRRAFRQHRGAWFRRQRGLARVDVDDRSLIGTRNGGQEGTQVTIDEGESDTVVDRVPRSDGPPRRR